MTEHKPTLRKLVAAIALALLLSACAPQESLDGGEVLWESDDGQERIVQVGPCVKSQTYDDVVHDWYTRDTTCEVPRD